MTLGAVTLAANAGSSSAAKATGGSHGSTSGATGRALGQVVGVGAVGLVGIVLGAMMVL